MVQVSELTVAGNEGIPVINLRSAEFERDPRAVLACALACALAEGPVAKTRRGFEFLSYALISEAATTVPSCSATPARAPSRCWPSVRAAS